ncbi:hypothetical protein EVAR_38713_1 [Eumeta japonica]|uniref:Uncharacterized protein n=1 Tax=Eumeta variegata TaxID=151549 RepID=A0A4C1XJX1_EUMVA|nr:hypothetical protein EVAR_38713_1 [Eumeta japonica]
MTQKNGAVTLQIGQFRVLQTIARNENNDCWYECSGTSRVGCRWDNHTTRANVPEKCPTVTKHGFIATTPKQSNPHRSIEMSPNQPKGRAGEVPLS